MVILISVSTDCSRLQPKVDACSSGDPVHGWGPSGGYVFQKEFIELFCSPAKVKLFLEVLENFTEMQGNSCMPQVVCCSAIGGPTDHGWAKGGIW